jgi:ubiquinone/menaquinone biosynthesis C-methylase UbiE
MISTPMEGKDGTSLFKEKQKFSHEELYVQYEGNEYHDYFRRLPFAHLEKLLKRASIELDGTRLHVASCGSGIDINYLTKQFKAKIFATDYSNKAVEIVRNAFPNVEVKVEDNEKLSFSDNYFAWSFIAASLHHLPRPILGLYELLRVSKHGIIVMEPNDSFLTRFATSIGMIQEYEVSGNYVYRISKRDVCKVARSGYCDYFINRCFAPHRVAKKHFEFIFLKWLTLFCNATISPLGNYVVFIIKKRSNSIV